MNLYQLGEYNRRTDLTEQGTLIRNFVQLNYDYISIKNFVSGFDSLEEESIIILRMAILAGYWDSYYGFMWTAEQEIEFWELVLSKNQNSGVAILTLAESYRIHSKKTLKEVLPLYFKAIEINHMHFYSLSSEDRELLRKDDEVKYEIVKIEIDIYEEGWNKADFEEEYPYIIDRCNGDIKMIDYVKTRFEEILKNK